MMQVITKEHVAFQEAHMQGLLRQLAEAERRGDRTKRDNQTREWIWKARESSPALDRPYSSPYVDRWMDLDCRIIDPKTGEITDVVTVRRRSRQLIKRVTKTKSGKHVAPMNSIVVDIEGEPDVTKEFGSPSGYRLTSWHPVHGLLTREEKKAINARRKAARKAMLPVQSPVKSRDQKIKEIADQIEVLLAAVQQMSD